MREYFTIMIKENDTGSLKLLTEKLNEGFHVDNQVNVGRSAVIMLQRRVEESLVLGQTINLSGATRRDRDISEQPSRPYRG